MFGTRGENPKINPPVIRRARHYDKLELEFSEPTRLTVFELRVIFYLMALLAWIHGSELHWTEFPSRPKVIFSEPPQGGGKFYRN